MKKISVKIPENYKQECGKIIHTAAVAAGAAAIIPIPFADTIPITAAQVVMLVELGGVFDISISESMAKAILGCGVAQQAGKAIAGNVLKAIPGIGPFAAIVTAPVASAITEGLGWIIAEDFYNLSVGEKPNNIVDQVPAVFSLFEKKKNEKSSTKKVKKNIKKK